MDADPEPILAPLAPGASALEPTAPDFADEPVFDDDDLLPADERPRHAATDAVSPPVVPGAPAPIPPASPAAGSSVIDDRLARLEATLAQLTTEMARLAVVVDGRAPSGPRLSARPPAWAADLQRELRTIASALKRLTG